MDAHRVFVMVCRSSMEPSAILPVAKHRSGAGSRPRARSQSLFRPAVNGLAALAVSISAAAAVCGAAKALPGSAKGRGWRSGAARLASRREGLADQSTITHRQAIGPHHGAHIKLIAKF